VCIQVEDTPPSDKYLMTARRLTATLGVVGLMLTSTAAFAPGPPLRSLTTPPLLVHQQARAPRAAAPVQLAQQYRQSKREVLLAKGIAGAVLLRVAATSQVAAIGASIMMLIVAITPVLAVWAMLLTAFMMFIGAASYWPTNLVAMCLGTVGVGGALNGMIVSWERMVQRRRATRAPATGGRKQKRDRARTRDSEEREDDDGSAGLVALLVGALTAAIVGALP
jgi:hypothetical protein